MYKFLSLLIVFILTISAFTISFGKTNTSVLSFQTTNNADETERFDQTYSFNPNGRIEIGNINGSITVEAWDNPQIRLEYIKTGDRRENLENLNVIIEAEQDIFKVKTDYEKQNGEKWNRGKSFIEYRLMVPRTAILDKVVSVNGNINISDMTNSVEATTVNGNISAMNLSGELEISTVNGTVNAELNALKSGSRVDLSTVNGTINLFFPSIIDANFSGSTISGSIKTDFDLTVKKSKYSSGSSLTGTLGSGSSSVKVSSVNGTIAIKQGSATNL